MESADSSSSNDEKKTQTAQSVHEDFGLSLYPERKKMRDLALDSKEIDSLRELRKDKCERNVYWAQKVPIIKLLTEALDSCGCPFDLRRHVACEECDPSVSGGYDQEMNQIVICQNVVTKKQTVMGTMAHELIHMFDYCTTSLDFRNIDHLACTEIRAACLTNCSYLGSLSQGTSKPWDIRKTHQMCVKDRAIRSIISARNVDRKTASEAVERVFAKCYDDLEPIGRIIRRNSDTARLSYKDAYYFGYTKYGS